MNFGWNFRGISKENMGKQFIQMNIGDIKNEVFLNKYFGVERTDIVYIKSFLEAINKVDVLPMEYEEKYGSILKLINQFFASNDEEKIKICKTMDLSKKTEYQKLLKACEKDGNEVLRSKFVSDLKSKNDQIINAAEHKEIVLSSGKTINVYELAGQPFTMLVHAVADNKLSEHNSFAKQIVKEPKKWNEIYGGNNNISTSLISDKYMVTYAVPNDESAIMFGFNSLSSNSVKIVDIIDAAIPRNAFASEYVDIRDRKILSIRTNSVTTIEDLMEKTIEVNLKKSPRTRIWNEILLSRFDKNTGMKITPDFVVCMDRITEVSKKAAEEFNVPIYFIDRKFYPQLPYVDEKKTIESEHMKR